MNGQHSRPLYFLLQEPLPSDYVDKFLGRVVVQMSSPTVNYEPDKSIELANIYEDPVKFSNVRKVLETAKDTNAKIGVTKILTIFSHQLDSTGRTIKTPLFKRYNMTRIPQKFAKLMEDPAYSRPVLELLKKQREISSKPLALVTGLLTCCDMEVSSSASKKTNTDVKLGVPDSIVTAAGGPPGLESQFEFGRQKQSKAGGRATAEGELVVAVSYHELWLKKVSKKWTIFTTSIQKTDIELVEVKQEMLGDFHGFFGRSEEDDEDVGQGKEFWEEYSSRSDEDEWGGDDETYMFELCYE